jgi:phenylacetyl-CoA:acceptor oxidoreductase subunit 2
MSADGKPWLQAHWDWHVALNFLTGGAGGGLLAVGGLAGTIGTPITWPMLLGMALIGAGLAQVSLHLGRPLRSWNVLRNPGTSWMSREAYVAGPTLLLALLAGLTGWKLLGLLAAACGLAFVYCQARMLTESKGIPAWRTPRLMPLVMATGLAEGGALFMLIGLALSPAGGALLPAALAVLVLLAARFVTWRGYVGVLAGNAPQAALAVLSRNEGAFVGVGHALPALLLVVAFAVPAAQPPLAWLAGLVVLGAGWWIKFTIVTRAGYNQGFAIMHTPARGAGSSGVGSKPGW